MALAVNPASASGPFVSPFANLSFGEKATVFAVLETDPAFADLTDLVSIVPGLLVFIACSEAPVWDRGTRTLTATPFGWSLTGFSGPAEGRDDFQGYYGNRRKASA